MSIIKNRIALKIKIARKQLKLTLEELAKILGVSKNAVHNWESGISGIENSNIEKIAEMIGEDPSWFFTPDDASPPESVLSAIETLEKNLKTFILQATTAIQINGNLPEQTQGLSIEKKDNLLQFPLKMTPKISQSLQYIDQPVGAGYTLAECPVVGSLNIECETSKNCPTHAFFVSGQSMEPDIPDGSLLLVRATRFEFEDRDIVIAFLTDTEQWTVRQARLIPDEPGKIKLVSSKREEIYDENEAIIQGVVLDVVKDKGLIDEIMGKVEYKA